MTLAPLLLAASLASAAPQDAPKVAVHRVEGQFELLMHPRWIPTDDWDARYPTFVLTDAAGGERPARVVVERFENGGKLYASTKAFLKKIRRGPRKERAKKSGAVAVGKKKLPVWERRYTVYPDVLSEDPNPKTEIRELLLVVDRDSHFFVVTINAVPEDFEKSEREYRATLGSFVPLSK
jgi:hypothetical protein